MDAIDETGKDCSATVLTEDKGKIKSTSRVSNPRTCSLSSQKRYSVSAISMSSRYRQISLSSSKSASSTLSTKKSGAHSISKLIISNHPTMNEVISNYRVNHSYRVHLIKSSIYQGEGHQLKQSLATKQQAEAVTAENEDSTMIPLVPRHLDSESIGTDEPPINQSLELSMEIGQQESFTG